VVDSGISRVDLGVIGTSSGKRGLGAQDVEA
jgi:hypothetical protein